MFQRKTPYEQEWEALKKEEARFFRSRETRKDNILNQKLEGKVPDKLQHTLDAAFEKAFVLIFEKGTRVIEKTYRKEELEKAYKIRSYTDEVRGTKKTLNAFSKKAKGAGRTNMFVSGVSGIGMGVLGIGIPDIPVFTGMLLRSIYEIALHYGYEYESEEERAYILLLIRGAMTFGDELEAVDRQINEYIETGRLPADCDREELIRNAAGTLSEELLYMKFLQGIPIVGVVGGMYDAVCMKRITEYANLKYRRRFLLARRQGR